MKKDKKILLIGGSGNLGSSIINSRLFDNLYSPKKKKLNILNRKSIQKILEKNMFDKIIHCAAMARIVDCEKNISKAINVNILGTFNLVKEILNYQIKHKRKIKFIYISSDGVYPSKYGNYSEKDPLGPYNIYGWTKLCSEKIVKKLEKHVVIRTRFFDKKNIRFDTAAIDIFTSMMEVKNLVKAIKIISQTNFIGIINVGNQRKSNFENYKKFKANIKPCKRKDIVKHLNFKIARDASMNLKIFNKLKNKK